MIPVKISPTASVAAACAVLSLVAVALPSARAEPATPHDRCDYMNHESKAYKACIAEVAQAKLSAEAAPVAPPKPKPDAQPRL